MGKFLCLFDSLDQIGSTQTIQDNLISKSVTLVISAKYLLSCKSYCFKIWEFGCGHLWETAILFIQKVLIAQSCWTLCDPTEPDSLLCPWDSPGKNTGVGRYSLLQGIFLTQGSKLSLLHWQADISSLSPTGNPSWCCRATPLAFVSQ